MKLKRKKILFLNEQNRRRPCIGEVGKIRELEGEIQVICNLLLTFKKTCRILLEKKNIHYVRENYDSEPYVENYANEAFINCFSLFHPLLQFYFFS